MPRPLKYATAKEAAHNNLYSKMAGQHNFGLSLEQFMHLVTGKCDLCGQPPKEILIVDRKDGRCELAWHYIIQKEDGGHVAMCRMCRMLTQQFKIKDLISHCARIMAKRMWQVHSKWTDELFQSQDKPQVRTSAPSGASGIIQDQSPVIIK